MLEAAFETAHSLAYPLSSTVCGCLHLTCHSDRLLSCAVARHWDGAMVACLVCVPGNLSLNSTTKPCHLPGRCVRHVRTCYWGRGLTPRAGPNDYAHWVADTALSNWVSSKLRQASNRWKEGAGGLCSSSIRAPSRSSPCWRLSCCIGDTTKPPHSWKNSRS